MSIVQLFPSPFIRFNLLVALLAVRYISHLLVTNPLIMFKFASTELYLQCLFGSSRCLTFCPVYGLCTPAIFIFPEYTITFENTCMILFWCILYSFVVAT
ncbi:hypothetical protein KC19_9G034100 [Ceratodon purpureus]|uniref:Uncharacterized protein n=1 Tax=Ceratodon purpureus TaxID=3225 RepID=A0A8T0GPW7_CERPU|nr:hypothetical protein KC19_9G034100 [Ceratodon purpureus]